MSLLDKGLAHDSPVTALEYLVKFRESSCFLIATSRRLHGESMGGLTTEPEIDTVRQKNLLAHHDLDITQRVPPATLWTPTAAIFLGHSVNGLTHLAMR